MFIESGSRWEIGYGKTFSGKLRDGLLNREVSCNLQEARTLIGAYRASTTRSAAQQSRLSSSNARGSCHCREGRARLAQNLD